jgi:hypothetical protein
VLVYVTLECCHIFMINPWIPAISDILWVLGPPWIRWMAELKSDLRRLRTPVVHRSMIKGLRVDIARRTMMISGNQVIHSAAD